MRYKVIGKRRKFAKNQTKDNESWEYQYHYTCQANMANTAVSSRCIIELWPRHACFE